MINKNRIARKINQELIDDMHKWSKIIAEERIGASRKALFIAEETVSILLRKIAEGKIEHYKLTNDFIFVALKNGLINEIKRYNETNKRRSYNDYNNIQLNDSYENMELELEDVSIYELKEKIEEEEEINKKIAHITKIMLKNRWIEEQDIEIFINRYIHGKTAKEFKDEMNISTSKIYIRSKRIKNVLNYLYKKN